jgi:hypothetical protein
MKKLLLGLALTLLCVAFNGCATKDTGSREYKPGKGWVPT